AIPRTGASARRSAIAKLTKISKIAERRRYFFASDFSILDLIGKRSYFRWIFIGNRSCVIKNNKDNKKIHLVLSGENVTFVFNIIVLG
ncbi:MAG: hypothetical protein K2I91_03720, partial [Muribaculaceae bacterium]|nr:hypothetical protein [Muribaculaceae bacterium]